MPKNMSIRKSLAMVLTLAFLLGCAGSALALKVQETKPDEAGQPASAQKPSADALAVTLEPSSAVYKVGQAIQFKVKGNRDFYLYLFSLDKNKNRGVVLLPNSITKENLFKGGKEHVVPGEGVNIVADTVGTEKVVMLATTEKLNLSTAGLNQQGKVYTGSAEEIENQAKVLRVQPAKNEKVFQEIDLVIINQ